MLSICSAVYPRNGVPVCVQPRLKVALGQCFWHRLMNASPGIGILPPGPLTTSALSHTGILRVASCAPSYVRGWHPTCASSSTLSTGSTAFSSLKSSFNPTRRPPFTARNTRLKNMSNVRSLSVQGGWHMITSRAVTMETPALAPARFHRDAALD